MEGKEILEATYKGCGARDAFAPPGLIRMHVKMPFAYKAGLIMKPGNLFTKIHIHDPDECSFFFRRSDH